MILFPFASFKVIHAFPSSNNGQGLIDREVKPLSYRQHNDTIRTFPRSYRMFKILVLAPLIVIFTSPPSIQV